MSDSSTKGMLRADEAGALPLDVDPVGRVEGLAPQVELEVGLRVAGHEGREPRAHAAEDHLVADLLEELRGVAPAPLDEVHDLQGAGGLGAALLVGGRQLVDAGVVVHQLLDGQGPRVPVALDLVPAAVLDGRAVKGPGEVGLRVGPHLAHEPRVAVQQLLDVVERPGEVRRLEDLVDCDVANAGAGSPSRWSGGTRRRRRRTSPR